jgi:hypothetical protein
LPDAARDRAEVHWLIGEGWVRARSLGARRQLFDLLAYALVQNSVARHRHRLRAGPPAEIAA